MKCENCQHWTVKRVTVYGDMSVIENWKAPDGKGACDSIGIETARDFGCNLYLEGGGDHVANTLKDGHPWQHFVMIPCPACSGGPGCHGRCKCAGTGLVRLYDDGYVGDEQTRKHPKEVEAGTVEPPKCASCSAAVQEDWVACPKCGHRLTPVAETVIVDGLGGTS